MRAFTRQQRQNKSRKKLALTSQTHAHLRLPPSAILLSAQARDFITGGEQLRRNPTSAGRRILKSRQNGSLIFFFGRCNLMWLRHLAPHPAFLCACEAKKTQVAACPDPEQVLTGDERKRYLDNLFDHAAARRGGG